MAGGFRGGRERSAKGKPYGVRRALPPVHVVKVSSKGQVVIPKEVRERHGLRRDTALVLVEAGDALVLRKERDVEAILKDEFAPLLQASESALKDLWDNPEDDVWNDL